MKDYTIRVRLTLPDHAALGDVVAAVEEAVDDVTDEEANVYVGWDSGRDV